MSDETAIFLPELRRSRVGVLYDDSQPNGRAVLFSPARDITTDIVNRMVALSGGIMFAALSPDRISGFLLSPMTRPRSFSGSSQAEGEIGGEFSMCLSVEAREGVSTGISAADRARTLQILGEDVPNPRKLVQPGHIFPVATRAGGVLVRNALAEATVDVARLIGSTEASAYIDLLDKDGSFLVGEKLKRFISDENLPLLSLGSLTRHRLGTEKLVHLVAQAKLPTRLAGEVQSYVYRSTIHEGEHVALVKGNIDAERATLTRVQPEFTFADVFGGEAPGTRHSLHAALRTIGEHGSGVLIYLRRPYLGELRQQVQDWSSKFRERSAAMMREYGLGAQILRDLGVQKIELLTGSKKNLVGIRPFGIEIVSQRPLSN